MKNEFKSNQKIYMTVRMYKTVAVYELYVSFDSRLVNVYKSTGVYTYSLCESRNNYDTMTFLAVTSMRIVRCM